MDVRRRLNFSKKVIVFPCKFAACVHMRPFRFSKVPMSMMVFTIFSMIILVISIIISMIFC